MTGLSFNDTVDSIEERTSSTNHEGGLSYDPDSLELTLTKNVINNLLEETFYESSDESFDQLVTAFENVAAVNPEFPLKLAKYARQEEGLRQVPQLLLVLSANHDNTKEYVRPYGKDIMDRADEPLEALAMQVDLFGKTIPGPLSAAIEDALHNFNKYQYAKWDRPNREWRYHDLLNLVHPTPRDEEREEIFERIALGERDSHPNVEPLKQEDTWEDEMSDETDSDSTTVNVSDDQEKLAIERGDRTVAGFIWGEAGKVTVEINGLVGGERAEIETPVRTEVLEEDGRTTFTPFASATEMGVSVKVKDPASTWRDQLQEGEDGYSMPIFARVRNVRNMLQAGLTGEEIFGPETGPPVTDDWVRNSKMFPFRFYQAYKAIRESGGTPDDEYAMQWLENAIDISAENVPDSFDNTLTVVDTSGSMSGMGISQNSNMTPMEIGSLFGAVMTEHDSDVAAFASDFEMLDLNPLDSVLTNMDRISNAGPGGGTKGYKVPQYLRSVENHEYDSVIIFTDMQMWGGDFEEEWNKYSEWCDNDVSLYLFDLLAYGDMLTPENTPGVYNISGWSSSAIDFIDSMENAGEMVDTIENVEPA